MNVETIPVDLLIPYARNARTHSPEQVAQIARSITEFGFTNPILIDEGNGLIAGHGRLMAAKLLGLDTAPCIRLVGLTEAQRRAYVIADNKLALNAGWDEAMLQAEIDALADFEFDLSLIGFDDDIAANVSHSSDVQVSRIDTGVVHDTFWISVRGPLAHQSKALTRLQELMAELPVSVELGTVSHE